MRYKTASLALLFGFVAASVAVADREIFLLSGDPNKVVTSGEFGTIRILDGDPNTFVFECYDPNHANEAPRDITSITVDPNAVGTVTISILPGPGHTYGAAAVHQINLGGSDAVGNIDAMKIAEDLAEDGPVLATAITGNLNIGGRIRRDIEIEQLRGDIRCDNMQDLSVTPPQLFEPPHVPSIILRDTSAIYSGTMDVGHSVNLLQIYPTLTGDVEISGDVADLRVPELAGDIYIAGSLIGGHINAIWPGATLEIGDDLGESWNDELEMEAIQIYGTLRVGRDLCGYISADGAYTTWDGAIEVGRNMSGRIWWGTATSTATLSIAGDYSGMTWLTRGTVGLDIGIVGNMSGSIMLGLDEDADLAGTITVGGDLSNWLVIHGELQDPSGDSSGGHIIVNGSLTQYGIIVDDGFMGDSEYIAIDYDGYDPNDVWQTGAIVRIGDPNTGTIYTGNSPAAHIYEVTGCRGDMNNDGACDPNDVADFYNALDDPNQFVADNPGLDGCAPWHGDLNQDSTFDIHDEGAMLVFSNLGCCAPTRIPTTYANCRADFDADGRNRTGRPANPAGRLRHRTRRPQL